MTPSDIQQADREALLPCPNPWCGSTEIIRISALDHAGYVNGELRSCVHCGLNGPVGADEAEALSLWNTRTLSASDEVVERVANLFRRAHSSSCYPTCTDYEAEAFARAVLKAIGESNG